MKKLCAVIVFVLAGLMAHAQINESGFSSIVSISPNPSKGIFNLNIENIQSKITIEIYNDAGQRVHSSTTSNPNTEIDLGKQAKGIYNIFLTDENKNVVNRKIVVQ